MMARYSLPDTPEWYMQGASHYYGVNEFRGRGYSPLNVHRDQKDVKKS
jgi:hypothetical protein